MTASGEIHPDTPLGKLGLPQGSVLAFLRDPDLREVVARAIDVTPASDQVVMGGIERAIELIAHDPSPLTLLVDLTGASEPLAALDRLAEVCVPGTRVIALGDINDIHFYRTLRGAGVVEYLHTPVTEAQLRAALVPPEPQLPKETVLATATGFGPVAVVGARGGVGTTMIAVALAWLAAERDHQRTVLVDLDLMCGSAGLALDLEGGRGLADALATPDRIDGLLVASASTKHGKYLSLLSAEPSFDLRRMLAEDAIKRLVGGLRQGFQRTVLDVPRSDPNVLRQSLEQAATIVIVTDFSLAGIRDTARLYGLAGKLAPTAKRLVVGNRLGVAKKGEVSPAEVEKAIGVTFTVKIPEDGLYIPHAINAGKPVPEAAPTSPALPALRVLAEAAGCLTVTRPPSLLERLFSFGKPKGGQS